MTDVTIDEAKARGLAAYARVNAPSSTGQHAKWLTDLADLLDPPAPTLRELVKHAIHAANEQRGFCAHAMPSEVSDWHALEADAVLAAVADWLEAQPLDDEHSLDTGAQRDRDVRLLRGES